VHAKRKKIWIDRFQTQLSVRLAMYFLMYMIAVLTWTSIDRVTRELVETHFSDAATFWSVLSSSVLVVVGFLFIYDMMRFSHRIVGPLFRFRKCVQAIIEGDEMPLMGLRKDDFLQELKDEFNEMLKVLEQRGAVKLTSNVIEDPKKADAALVG
jgi:nitrogen fixation/metabolism regulation signal transduction histidine kinase